MEIGFGDVMWDTIAKYWKRFTYTPSRLSISITTIYPDNLVRASFVWNIFLSISLSSKKFAS